MCDLLFVKPVEYSLFKMLVVHCVDDLTHFRHFEFQSFSLIMVNGLKLYSGFSVP